MRTLLVAVTFCSLILITSQISLRPSQSISVSGKLICKGKPAAGVRVKLYDHDTFTMDDLIAKGKTGADGTFHLSGTANEITRITPKLNVYHKCGKLIPICDIKFSIGIPKSAITRGSTAAHEHDVGTFNLENKFPGQGTDCLN
ncbi:unnamed protein product [Bursaphelenchus xylophilus]|uniref:(pine wood nematode) hypothetical protein n=1 Tax=Bursaphelenchus xylophilus TaxID=6326 RepID=A0A1I7RWN4_BURXY|nr:unnamed protein product [Bursaphelenchus xylophilus]CAG9128514.1 unnamed protein product [Bursaphelenchus xylophilus]